MKIRVILVSSAVLQALIVFAPANARAPALGDQAPADASDAGRSLPPAETPVRNLSNLVQGEPAELLVARSIRIVARDHTRLDPAARREVSSICGEHLQRVFPQLVFVDSTAADVMVLVSVSPIARRRPQAGVRLTALVVGYPPEPTASLRALYSYSGKAPTITQAASAFSAALGIAARPRRY
jgi:hypothetical protein